MTLRHNMRRRGRGALRDALVALCLLGLPAVGAADQSDARLPPLFDALRDAGDPRSAARLDADIWAIWYESADDAVEVALEDALATMTQGDYPAALRQLDGLVQRAPDFAEAWNTRATVLFLNGDYRESLRDIEATLRLEPRHFGALSGRGLCYLHLGELSKALEAFESALRIHPWLPGARTNAEWLRQQLRRERNNAI